MIDRYPWFFVAITFGVATAIGLIFPPQTIPWRMIDISAVIIGVLGLIPVVAEARRTVTMNRVEILRKHPGSELATLIFVCRSYGAICRDRIKRDPPAEDREDYERMNAWLLAVPQAHADTYPDLADWLAQCPKEANDAEIRDFKAHIMEMADSYGTARTTLEVHIGKLDPTDAEQVPTVFAPYLIGLALTGAYLSAAFKP